MTPIRPTGVVLAGGASRRMGRDKASLEVGGQSLAERAVEKLRGCCSEVLLADGGRGLFAGVTSVDDGPGSGPAAGILGAAAERPGEPLLVLACDLPLAPEKLLSHLATDDTADWLVPRWSGRLEPLCAIYRPNALVALLAQVGLGNYALHRLVEHAWLEVGFLRGEALRRYGDPARLFANINEPGDLSLVDPSS